MIHNSQTEARRSNDRVRLGGRNPWSFARSSKLIIGEIGGMSNNCFNFLFESIFERQATQA
jgi:hypothetical protein